MESVTIWLVAMVVLVIIEVLSQAMAAMCLAVGCLAAAIVSMLGLGMYSQIVALVIATVVAFVTIVPLVKRWKLMHTSRATVSNMDAVIGRVADVVVAIPEGGMGRVKVDGDNWQAVAKDGRSIAVGEKVKVLSYDSIILTVE